MSYYGQTHFKNLEAFAANLKVCLTILGHFALKGSPGLTHSFSDSHKKNM